MRAIPQGGPTKKLGPRQVPRSPPLNTPLGTTTVLLTNLLHLPQGYSAFLPRSIIATHYNPTTPIKNSNKVNVLLCR